MKHTEARVDFSNSIASKTMGIILPHHFLTKSRIHAGSVSALHGLARAGVGLGTFLGEELVAALDTAGLGYLCLRANITFETVSLQGVCRRFILRLTKNYF